MGMGAFFGGMAKGAGDELDDQQGRAFKMKVANAQIEGKMRELAETARLKALDESAKYERESRLSKGVTDAANKTMGDGYDFTGAGVKDQSTIDAILRKNTDRSNASAVIANKDVYDEGTGIKTGVDLLNGNGVAIRRLQDASSVPKIALHGEISQLVQNIAHAGGAYGELSVQGGGAMAAPLDWAANLSGGMGPLRARAELAKLNRSTSILQGKFLDKVPGGRASIGLATRSDEYMLDARNNPALNKNIMDNVQYQAYKALKEMGPNTKIDGSLVAKFENLPHDKNGIPVNVRWKDGQAYMPGSTVPLKLEQKLTPQKAEQLRAEGETKAKADNPFGDDAAFKQAVEDAQRR